ncbi:hypothetical protein BC830DRAFT_868319 [Chytriomyces sp. MP71]|nr:hypothetical protein BC830DRAFT_868319 [Chytriomyces sp. MP71]
MATSFRIIASVGVLPSGVDQMNHVLHIQAPASQGDMAAIARATHNHRDFIEIMEMIDKRLNDSGKNWRHVYKSLVLLDFLLIAGSENVIKYAKENLYVIKTLKEFIYLDEDGRDHGANVRQLSKDITAHLSDDARLREERSGRNNHRWADPEDEDRDGRRYGGGADVNDDDELRRALEESKRTAQAEERRRAESQKTDSDLKKALEINDRENKPAPAPVKEAEIIDFFSPVQNAQPNLFETGSTPFGGFGYQDPFAAQQLQQQQMQQQMLLQQQQQQQQLAYQQQQQLLQQQQQQQLMSQQTPFGGFGNNSNAFSSAPTGFEAYTPAPVAPQPAADPLGDVARNSSKIDPFGALAMSRNSVAVGVSNVRTGSISGGANPFGGVPSAPFGGSNNNSNFGTSATDVFANNSNAFASVPLKNPFGGAPTGSPFGTSNTSSPFGTSVASSRPVTGGNAAFADLSPFPKSATSNVPLSQLGSSAQGSPFGTSQATGFGGAAAQPFGTGFGGSGNQAFGTQQPFGGAGSQQPFGSSAQQSFGSSAQQPFGSAVQQPFGTAGQQQPFGTQGGTQPFGGASAFGQQQQPFGTSGFPMPGQQQQQNAFGQPQQNVFGQTQQNAFAQPQQNQFASQSPFF